MMALTPEAVVVIRQWVGADPDDTTLEDLFTQYANHDRVVLHVLNERLSNLSLEPASLTVPGLSISNGANIQALQALIQRFTNGGGTGLDDPPSENLGFAVVSIKRNYPR